MKLTRNEAASWNRRQGEHDIWNLSSGVATLFRITVRKWKFRKLSGKGYQYTARDRAVGLAAHWPYFLTSVSMGPNMAVHHLQKAGVAPEDLDAFRASLEDAGWHIREAVSDGNAS